MFTFDVSYVICDIVFGRITSIQTYCSFLFVHFDFKTYRVVNNRINTNTSRTVTVTVAVNKACYYSNIWTDFMDTNDRVRVTGFDGKKSVANPGYGQQRDVNDQVKWPGAQIFRRRAITSLLFFFSQLQRVYT